MTLLRELRQALSHTPLSTVYHSARDYSTHSRQRRFYRQFIRPGELAFDIGANHGERTALFLDLGARVVSVEPQRHCIASLKRIQEAEPERFANHVIVRAGVGALSGYRTFYQSTNDLLSSFDVDWIREVKASGRFGDAEWTTGEVVPIETLDRLIAKWGTPRFIKVDVEGHEPSVLAGLSRWPSPDTRLSFEFTPERMGATLSCLRQIDALLPTARYNFSEGESMRLMFRRWKDRDGITAFLHRYQGDTTAFGDVYVAPHAMAP